MKKMVAVTTNLEHLTKSPHRANTGMATSIGHACHIPTDDETQLILHIGPKMCLVPWLFKVGDSYPPVALTPCLFQGHRLSIRSSLHFQDNSI
jgi:hypothetical protein